MKWIPQMTGEHQHPVAGSLVCLGKLVPRARLSNTLVAQHSCGVQTESSSLHSELRNIIHYLCTRLQKRGERGKGAHGPFDPQPEFFFF